jgi:hypothetical protein
MKETIFSPQISGHQFAHYDAALEIDRVEV